MRGWETFYPGFNTSHVVIYHHTWVFSEVPHPCFNTSHVVIYLKKIARLSLQKHVSIHLMLLFILCLITIWKTKKCFNTSHVVIYLFVFRVMLEN